MTPCSLAQALGDQAWLERLVAATGRGPNLPFLFAFVIVIMTTAVIAILPLAVGAIVLVALPAVAIVTFVTLFHHTTHLLIVLLVQFTTHLTSHALLDLTAFLCQGAICYLKIKNVLEVLCNRLKHLVAKTLTALNILSPVIFVEGHVEPLKLGAFWVDACLLLGELLPFESSL
jgi:hypothetical protein